MASLSGHGLPLLAEWPCSRRPSRLRGSLQHRRFGYEAILVLGVQEEVLFQGRPDAGADCGLALLESLPNLDPFASGMLADVDAPKTVLSGALSLI